MTDSKDVEIAKQLTYRPVEVSRPIYKYSKILPQSGSQQVTITQAGGQESLLEIPTKVFNNAQSQLSFDFTLAASGTAGRYQWFREDAPFGIRQIQLYTRSGKYLCDIPNFANYFDISVKKETRFNDYITRDPSTDIIYPSGQIKNNTEAKRPDNSSASVSYLENAYCSVGGNNAASGPHYIKLNLKDIKNSIFSYDKNLVFPEVIILRIVWDYSKYVWTSISGTDPSDTAAAFTGNVTINNLTLYLAVETNPVVERAVKDVFESKTGYSLFVPYIHSFKNTLTNASTNNISLRFGAGHGKILKKIMHSVYNGDETKNIALDRSNTNGAKVTSFYTMLNNNRLQEFDLGCATTRLEDYMMMKTQLEGSITLNSSVYQYNWFYCDQFTKELNPNDYDGGENNVIDGLPITNAEQKWDFYATMAANNVPYNHYSFAVVLKQLTITPLGVDIV